MMPDWKFLRTNGKKNSTGIMEMIIAARLIVMGDTRCIIVSGKPSVIVELCIDFSRKYCYVCKSLELV